MKKKDKEWIDKRLEFNRELLTKLNSEYKMAIIGYLSKNKNQSISQIQREMKISYKETYRHVKDLVDWNWVKREKKLNQKHAPVYLNLTEKGWWAFDTFDLMHSAIEKARKKSSKPIKTKQK